MAEGHHVLEGELAEMVFEPRVGGASTTARRRHGVPLGAVLAYEPPDRLVFSWDITNQWQIEADPAKTSEVEVTFVADGPGRTNVVLEHRNLDRHGEGWESHRDAVGSPDRVAGRAQRVREGGGRLRSATARPWQRVAMAAVAGTLVSAPDCGR